MTISNISGIGKGRAFYAIALIGLLFFLVNTTEPVPNFDEATQTILKSPTDFVVPTNVTYFHAMLGTALVIALFLSDVKGGRKITEREAAKIAFEEIKHQRDTLKIQRYQGVVQVGNIRPRRIITKAGTDIYKWIVGINIKQEESRSYYQVELDTEGTVEAIISRKWEFGLSDVCWKCGESGDIKKMLPQEIYDLRDIRGVVRG